MKIPFPEPLFADVTAAGVFFISGGIGVTREERR